MLTNTAAKLAAGVFLCVGIPGAMLAQTSPPTGPTAPPKTLPVPKVGESVVIKPTKDECRAGWLPSLRWTKEEFDRFCRQMKISK
jgi:hypothetical protein